MNATYERCQQMLHDLLQHAGLCIVRETPRSVWEELFARTIRLAILGRVAQT